LSILSQFHELSLRKIFANHQNRSPFPCQTQTLFSQSCCRDIKTTSPQQDSSPKAKIARTHERDNPHNKKVEKSENGLRAPVRADGDNWLCAASML